MARALVGALGPFREYGRSPGWVAIGPDFQLNLPQKEKAGHDAKLASQSTAEPVEPSEEIDPTASEPAHETATARRGAKILVAKVVETSSV